MSASASAAGQGEAVPVAASAQPPEIGQTGGERAKGVLTHPPPGQVLEGLDGVVGQKLGEAVTPIDRLDGERVEFERPARLQVVLGR